MNFAGNGETKKEDLHIIHRIARFHEWRPINYSFVYVLIRPTSIVQKEHFFCILSVLTSLVGLPFMQSVYNWLQEMGQIDSIFLIKKCIQLFQKMLSGRTTNVNCRTAIARLKRNMGIEY